MMKDFEIVQNSVLGVFLTSGGGYNQLPVRFLNKLIKCHSKDFSPKNRLAVHKNEALRHFVPKNDDMFPSPSGSRVEFRLEPEAKVRNSGEGLKCAFTLAEVLITLLIIGIVAAMTLPTLYNKITEKMLVVRAKKNYSLVTQALQRYNYDHDSEGMYSYLMNYKKSNEDIAKELNTYFKGSVLCFQNGKNACWDSSYKIHNLAPKNDGFGNYATSTMLGGASATLQLVDGSFLSVRRETTQSGCGYTWTKRDTDEDGNYIKNEDGSYKGQTLKSTRCGRIRVDTNGTKAPNRIGTDVFTYQIQENGISFMNEEGDLKYVMKNNAVQPYTDYNEGKYQK